MTRHYTDVLRHVGRPSDPADRENAPSVMLADYKALFLESALEEYGFYVEDDTERTVSLGLAEYIGRAVRDDGDPYVSVYIQTETARDTVVAALESFDDNQSLASQIMSDVHGVDVSSQ